MSCNLNSNRHTYVVAMLVRALGVIPEDQIHETARILRILNDESLRQRYGAGEGSNPMGRAEMCEALLSAGEWIRDASNADLLWCVKGFAYQCSEAPESFPGQSILSDLIDRLSALPDSSRHSSVWSI